MTSSLQPTPIPIPALLVYGKPTTPDLPQALWFRAEDRAAVMLAAQSLKLSVLEILTDAQRTLIVDVHEGVLKANSRMIVGSVTSEAYKRIEEFAANASLVSEKKAPSEGATGEKGATEQNTNVVGACSPRATPPQVAAGKRPSETRPVGTKSASSRDSGSRPSNGSRRASLRSSGSKLRNTRRSRPGPKT